MQTSPAGPQFVKFLGIKINNIAYRDAYGIIRHTAKTNGKGYVCMTDVGNVVGATQDCGLFEAINSSLLSLADGTPLVWFAKLLGCKQIERISGMDLMMRMFSERDGLKHLLLGDTEQRISRVIEKARSLNDCLSITGYSPPFKEFNDEDNRSILALINRTAPDVIWVSFGGGKQEKWMQQNLSTLNRGVMIGVGAAFKWLIGELVLPPRIIQRMGLQWTFRVTQGLIQKRNILVMRKIIRILKKKAVFLLHFPGEVIRARRQ